MSIQREEGSSFEAFHHARVVHHHASVETPYFAIPETHARVRNVFAHAPIQTLAAGIIPMSVVSHDTKPVRHIADNQLTRRDNDSLASIAGFATILAFASIGAASGGLVGFIGGGLAGSVVVLAAYLIARKA